MMCGICGADHSNQDIVKTKKLNIDLELLAADLQANGWTSNAVDYICHAIIAFENPKTES